MAGTDPGVIQQIVAPAVMIPACAMLLLSSTSRMNTVLSRMRTFHKERLDVWCLDPDPESKLARIKAVRLEGIEHQLHRLMARVNLIRAAMLLFVVSIVCNLLSVLGLAARAFFEEPGIIHPLSVGVFLLGIVILLAGAVFSFVEIARINETIRYEHDRMERLIDGKQPGDAPDLTGHQGEGIAL